MQKICFECIEVEEFFKMFKELISQYNEKSAGSVTENTSPYLSREAAAKILTISLPTLAARTKEGYLISYRMKGRILYKRIEIENAMKKINYNKNITE